MLIIRIEVLASLLDTHDFTFEASSNFILQHLASSIQVPDSIPDILLLVIVTNVYLAFIDIISQL